MFYAYVLAQHDSWDFWEEEWRSRRFPTRQQAETSLCRKVRAINRDPAELHVRTERVVYVEPCEICTILGRECEWCREDLWNREG